MLGVIRYKIWHDLWENKGRTSRVVVIIVIGAFAVGTIFGGAELMLKDVADNWRASSPATIGMFVDPPVDESMLVSLEKLDEIEEVVGQFQEGIQWRRSPDEPWQPALLRAVDDYQVQEVRKIDLDSGGWPERKLMGVQRGYGLDLGDQVYLRVDEREYEVELNGVVYDAASMPPFAKFEPVFFTTAERFEQLTGEANYNLILATIPEYSQAKVNAAADLVQHELEKQNVEINPALNKPGGFKTRTGHPDRFVAQDVLDGVTLVLKVLSICTLVLGMFLVYNTINAVIVQQVNQIGVMKAVGARFNQILFTYFSLVFIYALLALIVAGPLGIAAAHGLRVMLVSRFNMIPGPFEISITAVTLQTFVALLFPILVTIAPIVSGARVTVREAISTYGLDSASGSLDRMLAQLGFIPRNVVLTISNTFRNTRRVLLTQVTLAGAGILFMMVMNIQTSLTYTFDEAIFSIFDVNVMIDLERPERIKEIERLTLALPEVEAVEVWGAARGTVRLRGQPESNDDNEVRLRGMPFAPTTYIPQMREGRWLQEGDKYVVVLNQELAEEMGVGVGDWITVDIPNRRESDWLVVGTLFEPMDQQAAIAPRETLLGEANQAGRGQTIRVQTVSGDAASEAAMAKELQNLYETQGYEVRASTQNTSHRLTDEWSGRFSTIIALLSFLAVLISIAGAVALSGTLAINVLERTREIGVMRAIGASSSTITGLFIGEGLILGWLSWLIAIPLSIPGGQLIINTLSKLINIELISQFSAMGVLYWLAIVTVLAIVASWSPAQKAAQTSVRESLAYA